MGVLCKVRTTLKYSSTDIFKLHSSGNLQIWKMCPVLIYKSGRCSISTGLITIEHGDPTWNLFQNNRRKINFSQKQLACSNFNFFGPKNLLAIRLFCVQIYAWTGTFRAEISQSSLNLSHSLSKVLQSNDFFLFNSLFKALL